MRMVMLLIYVSMTLWIPHLIYFWFSVLGLCLAPFIFNPHQFSFGDFVIDYRETLRWLSRGNSRTHANSWIGYCRLSRTRITGFKKKKLGHPSEKLATDVPRAGWRTVLAAEIIIPLCLAICFVICYMFVKSRQTPAVNGLLRIAIISFGPIVLNMAVLLVLFLISVVAGPALSTCCSRFASVMAAIAHGLSVVGLIAFFEFLWCQSISFQKCES
jgi:1,3-beta-glucan synthase